MKFRKETIKEFNSYCDTTLTEDMTFYEAVDNIEKANNNYFYVSACEEDVVEAIESESDIASQLELELVHIDEVGVFIALQP